MRVSSFYVLSMCVVSLASFFASSHIWRQEAKTEGHAWTVDGRWQWKTLATETPTQQREKMEASYFLRMNTVPSIGETASAEPAL